MKKSKKNDFRFVSSDNPRITMDIFVPEEMDMGEISGHKVMVKLTSYGGKRKNPEGQVVEILGHVNDPGVDILVHCLSAPIRPAGVLSGGGHGGSSPCPGGAFGGNRGRGD